MTWRRHAQIAESDGLDAGHRVAARELREAGPLVQTRALDPRKGTVYENEFGTDRIHDGVALELGFPQFLGRRPKPLEPATFGAVTHTCALSHMTSAIPTDLRPTRYEQWMGHRHVW